MSWLGKLGLGVVGVALFVLAFFFLTVALAAGAIVGLALLGRLWWISRRLRREREESAIEGDFTVVERREAIRRIDDSPT
jgi:membrane protein implicated in regulation of membrane protease activity